MRFGGVLAVNKVSFDVRRGEVFTLIGPNGAGKTTVFNLISRIYTPTTGEIHLAWRPRPDAGLDAAGAACDRRAAASRAPSRTSSCSSMRRCCTTC